MKYQTYGIEDEHGLVIERRVSSWRVLSLAQEAANKRGCTVYVYPDSPGGGHGRSPVEPEECTCM